MSRQAISGSLYPFSEFRFVYAERIVTLKVIAPMSF